MDSAANTILSRISALNCGQKPVILAIDGRCASGKTTLAAKIQEKTRCGVIHMDDFFLRPEQRIKERLAQAGGNIDWERIKKEALEPIRANSAALYRPYDCHTQSFKEQIKIEPGPLIVFEGSYSCHPELFDLYDYHIFLSVEPEEQLRRILLRNGPQSAALFRERWIPMEENYFNSLQIAERCELCFEFTFKARL